MKQETKSSNTVERTRVKWEVFNQSSIKAGGQKIGVAIRGEDAAYICKAVNSFDELVETLRSLLQDIDHYGSVNMLPSSTAINHAKEVLTKATGGQS